MTSPEPPCPSVPTPSLGFSSADEARGLLLAAHHDVDDAVASARRSLWVAWESTAADRFRDDVTALLVELDADLQLLEDAAVVVAR
ncbi:hypothetical protein M1843_12275 [Isoptericola sp. 4D.3]|uniref:Aldehyde dehydrogenase family protein n=1 Tax=Isoptericola peretonis TaxID=2918523 RepID=A0ABT0J4W4_9MICO|nr:hypothetical protein [Isoptericola sp. 4D.3]